MIKKIQLYFAVALLVIGLAAAFLYFVNSVLDSIHLKKDFAYTISEPISTRTMSSRGVTDYKYTFFLESKWYAGFTQIRLRQDGTRYFIKFYPKNPNRNKATTVIANPEDIRNLPPGGYKEMPHK